MRRRSGLMAWSGSGLRWSDIFFLNQVDVSYQCRFQEFSINVAQNQIIRSTLDICPTSV
jgi:hypothetical protein